MPRQTQGAFPGARAPPPPYADVVGRSAAAALKVAPASETLPADRGAELRGNLTENSRRVFAELVLPRLACLLIANTEGWARQRPR